MVRKSFYQDQLLINLVTSSEGIDQFDKHAFADFLRAKLGNRLAGLQHTINDNVADRAKIARQNPNEPEIQVTPVTKQLLEFIRKMNGGGATGWPAAHDGDIADARQGIHWLRSVSTNCSALGTTKPNFHQLATMSAWLLCDGVLPGYLVVGRDQSSRVDAP